MPVEQRVIWVSPTQHAPQPLTNLSMICRWLFLGTSSTIQVPNGLGRLPTNSNSKRGCAQDGDFGDTDTIAL
jgi:hypothetical protein